MCYTFVWKWIQWKTVWMVAMWTIHPRYRCSSNNNTIYSYNWRRCHHFDGSVVMRVPFSIVCIFALREDKGRRDDGENAFLDCRIFLIDLIRKNYKLIGIIWQYRLSFMNFTGNICFPTSYLLVSSWLVSFSIKLCSIHNELTFP